MMSYSEPNCSESYSNKEKTNDSAANEQRGNDGVIEHTTSTATEQGSSRKRPFGEPRRVESYFIRQR